MLFHITKVMSPAVQTPACGGAESLGKTDLEGREGNWGRVEAEGAGLPLLPRGYVAIDGPSQ